MSNSIPNNVTPNVLPWVPKTEERNRITAYCQIVHEQWGDQPNAVVLSFAEVLELTEEMYTHRVSVGTDWQLPDYGWLRPENIGYLIIKNLEGERLVANPTEEERLKMAGRVLELNHVGDTGCWPIPPGGFLFVAVERADQLRIRCRKESTQYRIHVIPR